MSMDSQYSILITDDPLHKIPNITKQQKHKTLFENQTWNYGICVKEQTK